MNSLVVMILISAPLFVALVTAFLAGRFFSRAARSFFSSTAASPAGEGWIIAPGGNLVSKTFDGNVSRTEKLL